MVKYDETKKHAYSNGYTFTRDEKTGYYLSTKPTKHNKRQRLHVYVWEYYNGDIPKGYEVHHKDGDKYNNEIENFELLIGLKHRKLHGEEFSNDERRLENARKVLKEKAQPKAVEWHKSKEGREWHKKHGKEAWENRKINKYVCSNCGKEFKTINSYSEKSNTFCSNSCKSSWRRKKGYDNETRICIICGSKYLVNKYSKGKTCSIKCRGALKCLNNQKSKV